MAQSVSWQRNLISRLFATVLIVVMIVLFVFSPFYARAILWGLNKVPVTVNQVAAESQRGDGNIEKDEKYEPGSPEWIKQQQVKQQRVKDKLKTDQLMVNEPQQDQEVSALQQELAQELTKENHGLSMVEALAQLQDDYQQQNAQLNREKTGLDQDSAHVIVVLGGGLGGDNARNIVVNAYTKMRLERAVEQKKYNPLPILLSGVEAPYMQKWLKQHGVDALLLEDRSMNTCENTRFSSLLLQKKGGAPKVELVTDAYHMPRARRLFAINGIDTVPVDAPLPIAPTEWQPSKTNLMHSRRATYEAIATMRDIWFGETNCREVP